MIKDRIICNHQVKTSHEFILIVQGIDSDDFKGGLGVQVPAPVEK